MDSLQLDAIEIFKGKRDHIDALTMIELVIDQIVHVQSADIQIYYRKLMIGSAQIADRQFQRGHHEVEVPWKFKPKVLTAEAREFIQDYFFTDKTLPVTLKPAHFIPAPQFQLSEVETSIIGKNIGSKLIQNVVVRVGLAFIKDVEVEFSLTNPLNCPLTISDIDLVVTAYRRDFPDTPGTIIAKAEKQKIGCGLTTKGEQKDGLHLKADLTITKLPTLMGLVVGRDPKVDLKVIANISVDEYNIENLKFALPAVGVTIKPQTNPFKFFGLG